MAEAAHAGAKYVNGVHIYITHLVHAGMNPQSYHAIFPLMLYEGKETRAALQTVLGPLNAEMDELQQPHQIPGLDGLYQCEFTCCADLFALIKMMRPAANETLDNIKQKSCTCPCCGEQRSNSKKNNKAGWKSNLDEGVWSSIPNTPLAAPVWKLPLKKWVFCILHMKVRVAGTLLKYMAREAEVTNKVSDLSTAIQQIVRTFNITKKGEVVKSSGKRNTKQAKISALQGGQVDKLLECVRATYSEQSTQKEQESAQLWTDVLESIGLQANSVKQQRHTRLWELLTQCYDLLNNTDKITETQLEQYKHKIAQFGQTFLDTCGGLKGVTPYVHIMVKHSYSYLKEYGSLRPWSQESFEASHKRHKQLYNKTNFGGGKNGNPSSAFLQVLQKLFRRQYLQKKITEENASHVSALKEFAGSHRARAELRAKALRKAASRKDRTSAS